MFRLTSKSYLFKYMKPELFRKSNITIFSLISLSLYLLLPFAGNPVTGQTMDGKNYEVNRFAHSASMVDGSSSKKGLDQEVEFIDISDRLDFTHVSLVEGGAGLGGAAWLDFDNDLDLDLFLTNGLSNFNALFRNNSDGTFTDVAGAAGVANGLGNAAVAAADIDNDGHTDLFLTGDGGFLPGISALPPFNFPLGANDQTPTRLFHNRGDGTFEDITESANVLSTDILASAVFTDIDNDGFVDLFITGLGRFGFPANNNKLFRNNGNLTFTDISASAGIEPSLGACAVASTDFDQDGDMDILVANCNGGDGMQPFPTPFDLWQNNGDLTFTNVALQVGMTLPGFWMSVTPGDFDNDGDIDIFSTNVGNNVPGSSNVFPHALFVNNGDGTFTENALAAGVGDWEFGWGASFADFDNDKDLDLFFAGAFPVPPFVFFRHGASSPGRVFFNNGDGTFAEPVVPRDLSLIYTSGVAQADFDNDGFPDILVQADELSCGVFPPHPGNPILFHNSGNENNWITVRTIGTNSNRGGIGARIEAKASGEIQVREVYAGSSFMSQESPWPTFGLGKNNNVKLRVHWPSGLVEDFGKFKAGQMVTLIEGEGDAKDVKEGEEDD